MTYTGKINLNNFVSKKVSIFLIFVDRSTKVGLILLRNGSKLTNIEDIITIGINFSNPINFGNVKEKYGVIPCPENEIIFCIEKLGNIIYPAKNAEDKARTLEIIADKNTKKIIRGALFLSSNMDDDK